MIRTITPKTRLKFANNQKGLAKGKPFVNGEKEKPMSIAYRGQPYFVSEFGGIHWNPKARKIENIFGKDKAATTVSWGYGKSPQTLDEFYARFDGLCAVLLENPDMFGYCYTQLTDVFQEENGVYNFDRSEKFDIAPVRAAQVKRAAIEEKYNSNYDADQATQTPGEIEAPNQD